MTKTAFFIDGGYLDKILDKCFGRVRVDFGKLVTEICKSNEILRTYYYHCPPYISPECSADEIRKLEAKQKFFSALESIPRFQVRLGHLAYRGHDGAQSIFVQKRVDIMLAVDLILTSQTGHVDNVVLIAGDSDFEPALEVVKRNGVLVTLCCGPQIDGLSNYNSLWKIADERIELSSDLINRVRR